MSQLLHKAWGYLQQADDYWDEQTQPIQGKGIADKLTLLKTYNSFDTGEQAELLDVL